MVRIHPDPPGLKRHPERIDLREASEARYLGADVYDNG
jgi:hypothetical protein